LCVFPSGLYGIIYFMKENYVDQHIPDTGPRLRRDKKQAADPLPENIAEVRITEDVGELETDQGATQETTPSIKESLKDVASEAWGGVVEKIGPARLKEIAVGWKDNIVSYVKLKTVDKWRVALSTGMDNFLLRQKQKTVRAHELHVAHAEEVLGGVSSKKKAEASAFENAQFDRTNPIQRAVFGKAQDMRMAEYGAREIRAQQELLTHKTKKDIAEAKMAKYTARVAAAEAKYASHVDNKIDLIKDRFNYQEKQAKSEILGEELQELDGFIRRSEAAIVYASKIIREEAGTFERIHLKNIQKKMEDIQKDIARSVRQRNRVLAAKKKNDTKLFKIDARIAEWNRLKPQVAVAQKAPLRRQRTSPKKERRTAPVEKVSDSAPVENIVDTPEDEPVENIRITPDMMRSDRVGEEFEVDSSESESEDEVVEEDTEGAIDAAHIAHMQEELSALQAEQKLVSGFLSAAQRGENNGNVGELRTRLTYIESALQAKQTELEKAGVEIAPVAVENTATAEELPAHIVAIKELEKAIKPILMKKIDAKKWRQFLGVLNAKITILEKIDSGNEDVKEMRAFYAQFITSAQRPKSDILARAGEQAPQPIVRSDIMKLSKVVKHYLRNNK